MSLCNLCTGMLIILLTPVSRGAQTPDMNLFSPMTRAILKAADLERTLNSIVEQTRVRELLDAHKAYLSDQYNQYATKLAQLQTEYDAPTKSRSVDEMAKDVDSLLTQCTNLIEQHGQTTSGQQLSDAARACNKRIQMEQLLPQARAMIDEYPRVLNFPSLERAIIEQLTQCHRISDHTWFAIDLDEQLGPRQDNTWRSPLTGLYYNIQDLDRRITQHRRILSSVHPELVEGSKDA